MAKTLIATLKGWFITGAYPTQSNFSDLIDTTAPNSLYIVFPNGATVFSSALFPNITELVLFLSNFSTTFSCSGNTTIRSILINVSYGMTTAYDFSNATSLECVVMQNSAYLTSLNMSGCTSLKQAILSSQTIITTMNLTGISACQYISVNLCTACTSLTLTTLAACKYFNGSGSAFAVGTIDNIFVLLDANGISNGYLNVAGGTNAAPTGGSLNAHYVSLIAKGWTILKN
jgi:hypothetical protein